MIDLGYYHSGQTLLLSYAFQTDELLSEITQLKEDLKKKDETIKRLEHRLVSILEYYLDNCFL